MHFYSPLRYASCACFVLQWNFCLDLNWTGCYPAHEQPSGSVLSICHMPNISNSSGIWNSYQIPGLSRLVWCLLCTAGYDDGEINELERVRKIKLSHCFCLLSGAEEACWAHNPKVPGSKPGWAKLMHLCPSWSKGFDSSSNVLVLVSSNLTGCSGDVVQW